MADDENPDQAPASSDAEADWPAAPRRFRFKLIPAVPCGIVGGLLVIVSALSVPLLIVLIVMERGKDDSLLNAPGFLLNLTFIIISYIGIGLGGVLLLLAARSFLRERWRKATACCLIGLGLAAGFMIGLKAIFDS